MASTLMGNSSSISSNISPNTSSTSPRDNCLSATDHVIESGKDKVLRLNQEHHTDGPSKRRKTFGRTPDGQIFTVPETHDMVSQLLSPTQPKNASDILVLVILGLHISILFLLPKSIRILTYGILFLFWRLCYNAGIGCLLHLQSTDKRLVHWARRSRIFESDTSSNNPYPKLSAWLKRELETKIPRDYQMEHAPIEYNAWLLFRRLVDLILMCDFFSYLLFAMACTCQPAGETYLFTVSRITGGLTLVLFNIWVKLDAHRVVRDYAWYWGDFFFLIDQELTFDGVFEMAPHPMYSVGYAGYYGISMLAASYKVLSISILAHITQFAFLILVENPHIDKIYNPPPRRALQDKGDHSEDSNTATVSPDLPSALHQILGIQNTDMHRTVDVAVFLLHIHVFLLAVFTPSIPQYQIIFIINALFWRLWYTLGIGFILNRQSRKKSWTRHFIKVGDDIHEAWRQWKGIYHLSMHMCYASFIAAAWKMYHLPADWSYRTVLIRHITGLGLICLHLWTAQSIYGSLAEFGWFYGDFFFDSASKLSYNGIYRFLNNPERILGLAGLWGCAIITWSWEMFALALTSHILTLSFIQYVERPHMQKLYGESLRRTSGLSKGFRRALPKQVAYLTGTLDRHVELAVDFMEEFIESGQLKLANGFDTIERETRALFQNYPARITITRLADDLTGYDHKDYSLEVEEPLTSNLAKIGRRSDLDGENKGELASQSSAYKSPIFDFGAPIQVRWRSPTNHHPQDWVGLYMVSDNSCRQVTRISSRGRWIATEPGQYDSSRPDIGILYGNVKVPAEQSKTDKSSVQGEMMFHGDKLWWTTGIFEFRYHHAGKHNVMAISNQFQVRLPRFDFDEVEHDRLESVEAAVSQALFPIVRNCFDCNPDIAPDSIDEHFCRLVERDGKFARRVVFAVHAMFGIEFAPQVVWADGSVRNLASRICTSKKALVSLMLSR